MNPTPDDLARTRLFTFNFLNAHSVEEVASVLLAEKLTVRSEAGVFVPLVITPNVDHIVRRIRRPDAIADNLADRAQFALADGQPIVWASRLLGRPLFTRLAGSSLVAAIWPRIVLLERRAFVVAADAETADHLRREGESVSVVVAPMLYLGDRSQIDSFVAKCVEMALDHGAEFVFVTLGHPKQSHLVAGMIESWPIERPLPVFLAIGASFDMYYGRVRRAPAFLQKIGLEWLFRFLQEPRRLFRRYFVDDLAFLPIVVREWWRVRGGNDRHGV